ncbi:ABC transporter ATP-binding protein [Methanogenium organophilum]|uniref:Dipeptide/oligopeptide/nickel ABC transporter ATP-binding protein n=1 Tax=Methanogenium organophilum TaxID=2199 RepID=A0A9X9S2E7_METOG|nr:dipeptide/oligopeptide/nickel ABC transporter ATP-binding protein [Methanogenium organophilum]WAI00270.1 dipeptide/oligopeptide/nickel ABC transporter ATP-binding protein [Methanogenium organophilum]
MPLKAEGITVSYRPGILSPPGRRILDDVTLELRQGETYGLMGASGSGKSTLSRVMAGLETPREGRVVYQGSPLKGMDRSAFAAFRRGVQVMFQDPTAALNPKKPTARSLSDVLRLIRVPAREHSAVIKDALDQVGLTPDVLARTPTQLSGGQNQRLVLARILLLEPEYLLLDEPTSALDVSVQAQILRLLRDLREDRGMGYLFISHDRDVVGFMADRVGVLRDGRLCEKE